MKEIYRHDFFPTSTLFDGKMPEKPAKSELVTELQTMCSLTQEDFKAPDVDVWEVALQYLAELCKVFDRFFTSAIHPNLLNTREWSLMVYHSLLWMMKDSRWVWRYQIVIAARFHKNYPDQPIDHVELFFYIGSQIRSFPGSMHGRQLCKNISNWSDPPHAQNVEEQLEELLPWRHEIFWVRKIDMKLSI